MLLNTYSCEKGLIQGSRPIIFQVLPNNFEYTQ